LREFIKELRAQAVQRNDEILLGILSFIELMEDHNLLDGAIRMRDFLLAELVTKKWPTNWQAAGKSHYVNLVLDNIETFYGHWTGPELEAIRLNMFHRVSEGRGCFALDEMCELINLLVKHEHDQKDEAGEDLPADSSVTPAMYRV
jgi:hypothetical protein